MRTGETTRRRLIAIPAAAGLGALAGTRCSEPAAGPFVRELGRTGLKVSRLSVGGWHAGRMKERANTERMLHMAADGGVNFFDTAWVYQDGESEARLGAAFKGRRTAVHLMTKVIARDRETAGKQLHESLTRLQSDYIDLWQFHGVTRDEEVDQIFGPGGAAECAVQAKREGKVRHIGLTGHRPKPVLKALREHHDLIETIQVPVNVLDDQNESFLAEVVPEAVRRGIGVIAMKTCAIGLIVEAKIATPEECLRFVWSQPVSLIVSGMDHYDHLNRNLTLARDFQPMSAGEQRSLAGRARGKGGPSIEWYKFDGEKMRTFPAEALL